MITAIVSAIRAAFEAREVRAAPLGGAQKQALRNAGFDDGQVLEINQVRGCFSYANRAVLVGCSTSGDGIGLASGNSGDPNDWGQQ